VLGEAAESVMQLATESVDLACIVGDGLLAPDMGDGAHECEKCGRGREDDIAGEGPVEQGWILAQRNAENRLGRQEHHDDVDRVVVLTPVVLGPEAIRMGGNVTCMPREELGACGRIIACLGFEERGQRHLGIDDNAAPRGKVDHHVGALTTVVAGPGVLLDEVHTIEQPGGLNESAQMRLTPAASNVDATERGGELTGLSAQDLRRSLNMSELLADLTAQTGLIAPPKGLRLLESAPEPLERIRHGIELGSRGGHRAAAATDEQSGAKEGHADDCAGQDESDRVHTARVAGGSDTGTEGEALPA
jgi:hypothetical protein